MTPARIVLFALVVAAAWGAGCADTKGAQRPGSEAGSPRWTAGYEK